MNLLTKNEYSKFGSTQETSTKIKINLAIISICLILIFISIWAMDQNKLETVIVKLNYNEELTGAVSNEFLSFGLDSSLLRKMKNLPVNSKTFINLARFLSPAYVRIGGTSADCLYINETEAEISIINEQNTNITQMIDIDSQDITNFTITKNNFLSLYEFSKKAGIKMIFDLNVLLRNVDGTWNSDNAKDIILFAKSHEMELDWQMGNEPNSFFHVFKVKISPEQLAKDYCELRTLLNNLGYQQSILIGPEVNHIGDEEHNGEKYAKTFLENIHGCIDYFTWHQYYLNGYIAQVQDFINLNTFNRLPIQIQRISDVIKSSGQNISMWLSETSSAYGGGAPELSNRFVAGFLWLDKLGFSAKAGIQVVIRQSFFGGNYALIGPDLNPNPDWWVSVLFKMFVSKQVLNLSTSNNFGNIRLYAHCTSDQIHLEKNSTVVIYGVNLNSEEQKVYIQGLPKGSSILTYFLTSDNLQSRNIFMNGEILKLKNDGNLPVFNPKVIAADDVIILPPYSIVFFLIDTTKIQTCLR